MGGFLGELSKRLAERWLSLLVLPGLFYLAVAVTARTLGQDHALDVHQLTSHVSAWARSPTASSTAGQIVLLAAVLAGAAGVGLAAQALGSAAEQLGLAAGWRTWPWPVRDLARSRTASRRDRWDIAHRRYLQLEEQARQARRDDRRRPDPAARYAAYRDRTRISLERPDRPTWSGDRINAASIRITRDLNINLPDLWPSLWLHLPDQARGEITAARTSLSRATTLTGWALLYALLGWLWWPAVAVAAILALTSWHSTRTSAATYAQLLEAAARLYLTGLAEQFGLPAANAPLPALGAAITETRLSSPPPAQDPSQPLEPSVPGTKPTVTQPAGKTRGVSD